MPNDPTGRRPPGPRDSHARPETGPRDGRGPRVTPLRIGGATLGVIVALVVAWSLFGGSGRQPADVAAAGSPIVVAAAGSASSRPCSGLRRGLHSGAVRGPVRGRDGSRSCDGITGGDAGRPPRDGGADGDSAADPGRERGYGRQPGGLPHSCPGTPAAPRRGPDAAGDPGRLGGDPVERRTEWLGASGRADAAGRTPMTTDTAFALASISKTFTAAVVLAARRRGQGRPGRPGGSAPSRLSARPPDHGPHAARPHQRAAGLLLRPGDRPRPPGQPGRGVDAGADVALRAQAPPRTGPARSGATPTPTTCSWASS